MDEALRLAIAGLDDWGDVDATVEWQEGMRTARTPPPADQKLLLWSPPKELPSYVFRKAVFSKINGTTFEYWRPEKSRMDMDASDHTVDVREIRALGARAIHDRQIIIDADEALEDMGRKFNVVSKVIYVSRVNSQITIECRGETTSLTPGATEIETLKRICTTIFSKFVAGEEAVEKAVARWLEEERILRDVCTGLPILEELAGMQEAGSGDEDDDLHFSDEN